MIFKIIYQSLCSLQAVAEKTRDAPPCASYAKLSESRYCF